MAEYFPACEFDTAEQGFDVGIFDKNMLTDSVAFSSTDTIATDGELGVAESFSVIDGVHYIIFLAETLSIVDSMIKTGTEAIAEALSIVDTITTDGELGIAESFSTTDDIHFIVFLTEAFSIADSVVKSGAEAIAESFSITDVIATDGELAKAEVLSIVDSVVKSGTEAIAESFSVVDSEIFAKYMLMIIRKINVTFSAGNYESNIELED